MHTLRLLQIVQKFIPGFILKKLYSGGSVLCPFCGFEQKSLAPVGLDYPVITELRIVGAGIRRGGCYNCGSTDRERLVYIYLRYCLKIFEQNSLRILHFAPEKNLANALKGFCFSTYFCGDLLLPGYDYPNYVNNMDVRKIPFPDGYYDLVICNHLLEHVEDDYTAMQEILRVLKPGGQAVLQVPISIISPETIEDRTVNTPRARKYAFGQADHVRIYGQDYPERLKKAGFHVKKINIAAQYPQYGLNPDEDIFVGVRI